MRDANALREKRRSVAKGMNLLAIGGITLTLTAAVTAVWFTHPGTNSAATTLQTSEAIQRKSD